MLKKLNAIEKWKSAGYVRVLDMFKGSGMVVKPQWIPDDYEECYNGIRDDEEGYHKQ